MTEQQTIPATLGPCEVHLCKEVTVYGFRETIYVTNNDSPGRTKEFVVNPYNWCKLHDAEQRPLYAYRDGRYVP